MPKNVACTSLGTGVLITVARHDTDTCSPRSEHVLILVVWEHLEELLEAMAPRNAPSPGERPVGRHVRVLAGVSKTWWEWPVKTNFPSHDDVFEPYTSTFRTDDVFVVNGPLPNQPAPEVTFVLNASKAGEGMHMVFSEADVQSLILSLTMLWSGHLEEVGGAD